MKKINVPLLCLVAYVFLYFGIASVEVPPHMTQPYRWWDSYLVASCIALPGLLGWMARGDYDE